jgi:hypothetical protein
MTLAELIQEVQEKTHAGEIEILEIACTNWPHRKEFTPTQARLLTQLIDRQMHRRCANENGTMPDMQPGPAEDGRPPNLLIMQHAYRSAS